MSMLMPIMVNGLPDLIDGDLSLTGDPANGSIFAPDAGLHIPGTVVGESCLEAGIDLGAVLGQDVFQE